MAGVIFNNLSTAFDTLPFTDYCKPLKMQNRYGKRIIYRLPVQQKKQISYSGELYPLKSVMCDVPQGSIFSPLLFLISFNNTGGSLKLCDLLMQADDMVIFVSEHLAKEIRKSLSSDFRAMADWMTEIKLILNLKKDKTECMLFGMNIKFQENSFKIAY